MKRRYGVYFIIALVPLVLALYMSSNQSDEYWLHTFEHRQLDTDFYCEGATFGDVSGDGQKDLVSGPFWYEGPDFEVKHAFYEPETFSIEGYSDCFFPYVYDLDGDAKNDILIIGFPGEIATWYQNPGAGSGDWNAHVIFEGVDNESPTFADLTGDGKPEMIFLHEGQYGYAGPDWDNPQAPWTFVPVTQKSDNTHFTHGLGFGDVDGDGRHDMLEATGWHRQTGDGSLWTYHPYAFARGGSQMYAYDFDGDGDNDVITADNAHGWGLQWHENQGDNTFVRRNIMGEKPADNPYGVAFSQLHAMDLVDMDGDGVKDLITGKRYWAHMGKDPGGTMAPVIYWFKTQRTDDGGVDFVPYFISDATGVGTQLVVDDYNEDGLPDLVVGNKKGTAVYTHKKEQVTKEVWEAAQPVAGEKSE